MATESPSHHLDSVLSEFDTFLNQPDSDSAPAGLIYAFFHMESTARFDAGVLRACLVANCLHRFLQLRGRNFLKRSSAHDKFFDLIKAELGWEFGEEEQRAVNADQSDQVYHGEFGGGSDGASAGTASTDPADSSAVDGGKRWSEADEAARIASYLFGHSRNVSDRRLIIVVPEDCSKTWCQVERHLQSIFASDYREVHFSVITVGRVTFANGWASSMIDYITCRQNLIDSSYRHKFSFSGGDETQAPVSTRHALTFASICFELMVHPFQRSIIVEQVGYRGGIDQQEVILPQWARNGVFSSYNYARLCSILDKYARGVTDGQYPALKPLGQVDEGIKTKIAQEMAELTQWLSVVSKMDVASDMTGLESKLPNLRSDIFQFSGQFSTFYSKKRVLTDSVALSGQNADALVVKIHVLSRLKRLYLMWFRMLSITPVEVM